MTIKRLLFFSNIRTILISIGAFGFVARIVSFMVLGTGKPDREDMANFLDTTSHDARITLWSLSTILFLLIVSLINNFFNNRMSKRIVKPLEPLSEGVRQIQDNNFSFRIDYQNNDEFRPVCDAFNGMAAKLESSTAQQKKNEANRRELIAGISHDLRTPLTSIKGCIEGIETGVASTHEMRERYLGIIKNKATVMEHIIEQLFLFSKLDMDEFPLNLRNVDISLVISDIIEDSLPEYAPRGLAITLAEMPDKAYVSADVLMLRNVIINILENSARYKTKKQGQMEIRAALENNSVVLCFTDNGPGVPADMLPNLFNVFFCADPSRSKPGSGLGLAISAKIIERMAGSIRAALPDKNGLAIIITLPLLQEGTA